MFDKLCRDPTEIQRSCRGPTELRPERGAYRGPKRKARARSRRRAPNTAHSRAQVNKGRAGPRRTPHRMRNRGS